MKYLFLFSLILCGNTFSIPDVCTRCQITLEPMWENIEKNPRTDKFGGTLILIGSITFRKKINEKCCIEKLAIKWHGDHIAHLQGSLYKKDLEKKFLPIEENVLNDGTWNKNEQILVFDFAERKQTLGPTTIFYIVLTIPNALEPLLKNGHFSLVTTGLPEPFQQYVKENNTNLMLQKSISTALNT